MNDKKVSKSNNSSPTTDQSPQSPLRRQFLNDVAGLSTAGLVAGITGAGTALFVNDTDALGVASGINNNGLLSALDGKQRQQQVFKLQQDVAKSYKDLDIPPQPNNGDDARYATRIGSFTKGMPHNSLGEVDPEVYNTYLEAIRTGDRDLFDQISTPGNITLRNIENIWSIDYLGPDSHQLAMRPAPTFASAEQAGEFAELYWQAITRDIPFSAYDSEPLVQSACDDLSAMSDFRGPKQSGAVTPATLFRGDTPGDLSGPFISQFLAMNIPYGPCWCRNKF